MTAHATIRARHRRVQNGVVGGYSGVIRRICGTRSTDTDLDYAALAEPDELDRAGMDDDGGPPAVRL